MPGIRVRRTKVMTNTIKRPVAGAIFLVLSLAVMLFVPSSGNAAAGPDEFISNEVATVNGEILTENDLFFRLMLSYAPDTIMDLIEDYVILDQSEVLGVTLEQNAVVEYLATAYPPEKLASLIDAFGEDTLEETVSVQLLALKTVTSKISWIVEEYGIDVTEADIREYYIRNKPLWITPESVRFSLIEVDTQSGAENARARILAGETFEEVCLEISTHPVTRDFGGDIGAFVPKGYATGDRVLLEDTAFALETGELSEPLQVGEKWYLVLTTDKLEYNEPTLEEMSEYIDATIKDQMVQPYLEEWMLGLINQAELEVPYPLLGEEPDISFTPGIDGSFIAPVVANVNGRMINEGSLLFHLLRQNGSEVIKSIIQEVLFSQVAHDMGISVSEADARAGLEDMYGEASFEVFETAFGTEAVIQTYQRFMEANLALNEKRLEIIDQQGIEVTDTELHQYFLDNVHKWTEPEKVRFSVIVCETETDTTTARTRISEGESFEAVCSDVSVDVQSREYGGDIGGLVTRGTLPGELSIIEETAFNLAIGSVSQPIQAGYRWFLVKTTEKEDAYEPNLGEVRDMIYNAIIDQKVGPYFLGWQSLLGETSDIEIIYPIYIESGDGNAGSLSDLIG